jgi:hypothetical protein
MAFIGSELDRFGRIRMSARSHCWRHAVLSWTESSPKICSPTVAALGRLPEAPSSARRLSNPESGNASDL